MPELPVARRGDVIDVLHGESVADPYRWLEDTDSAETAAWVRDQNAATTSYLDALAAREEIRSQLAKVWDVTRYTAPYHHGGQWFFTRYDPGADQPVLRVADDPSADGRVLLDPNTLSEDGTVAMTSWYVCSDGSRLAYATSSAGSDWMTWRVRDVASGEDLDDVIEWSKFSNASWLPDASGFFYCQLDEPETGREYLDTINGLRLMLHVIGSPQADDELIYADVDPNREPYADVSPDGRWLIVTTNRGTEPETVVLVLDMADRASGLRPLIPAPDADSVVVGSQGSTFFVRTDAGAPLKRVVAIDLEHPEPEHWREVIPEGSDVLLEVIQAGDRLVAHVLHDASSQLQIWSTEGECLHEAEVPEHVTITELAAAIDQPVIHLGLTSFTDPASVWDCDVTTGATRVVRASALPADSASIVVTRVTAPSADGTEVPMFLLHRADVTPTGDVATLLYAYGGFDIAITPTFNAARLVWIQRGGLLAVANLRGGGEFGKDWWRAGRRNQKQNVFNDFAGCARWLAGSGWTRADRIAINGGSNGGLLVGAVLTQHPELIGAAVPEVGVLDLLRFHLFTIGWAWTGEYGDPQVAQEYQWVRAYSPLHAIKAGTAYPATLVMTGDHDDRVVPGHSFKFAATLQPAQRGSAPVLIRIETSGGHGLGTPVSKLIEARADMIAFVESALQVAG